MSSRPQVNCLATTVCIILVMHRFLCNDITNLLFAETMVDVEDVDGNKCQECGCTYNDDDEHMDWLRK